MQVAIHIQDSMAFPPTYIMRFSNFILENSCCFEFVVLNKPQNNGKVKESIFLRKFQRQSPRRVL